MTGDLKDQYPAEYAAFVKFREAKELLERETTFGNARAAKQAWIDFLNIYQPEDKKLYPLNVVAFPASRVVSSSLPNPKGIA